MTTTGATTFTTTERMIDGVHGNATDLRTTAQPAIAAGLAELDILVMNVSDLTDGGATGGQDLADLAGGHAQEGVFAFLGDELRVGAGGTAKLAALAGVQFDVVHDGTGRNLLERHGVAGLDVSALARQDGVALVQADGSQDVALFAVSIVQQRDAGAAVRIVFDLGNLGGNAELVALEIDDAVERLVSAAATAGSDSTVVVATGLLGQALGQRLLGSGPGDLGKVGDRLEPAARRSRLQLTGCHCYTPSKISILSPAASLT